MADYKTVPHEGPLFEAMMVDIDTRLAREGVAIEDRPIRAGSEVSVLQGVPVPIGPQDPDRLPPDLAPYAALGAAIIHWYDLTYGERLKVDMTPGRTVVQLDGDLYALAVPRLFGSVQFVVSRAFLPPRLSLRAPAQCNIVELIEHMTPAKAARLSNADLQAAVDVFAIALQASYTLEATGHDLLQSARADVSTAVLGLMDRHDRLGESKWASLQAAEKTLKAAIDLQGGQFPFTHNLSKLAAILAGLGVSAETQGPLAAIQCSPGIRYGEETCSRDDALIAHQSSLQLVNLLRDAGARFQPGLG